MKFSDIRNILSLSQKDMETLLGVSVGSVNDWERGIRAPKKAAVTLYKLIEKKDQDLLDALINTTREGSLTGMSLTNIREGLDLSLEEMSVLLGVSTWSIRQWEHDLDKPEGEVSTLYKLIKGKKQKVLCFLVDIASREKYSDLKDAQALLRVNDKLVKKTFSRGIYQGILCLSNPHLDSEELGFRTKAVIPRNIPPDIEL